MLSEHKEIEPLELTKDDYHPFTLFPESEELKTHLWFLVKDHQPKTIDDVYRLARTLSTGDISHYYGSDFIYQGNEILITWQQCHLTQVEYSLLIRQCAKKLYKIVYSSKASSIELDHQAREYAEETEEIIAASVATNQEMFDAAARIKKIDIKVHAYKKSLLSQAKSAGISTKKNSILEELETCYHDLLLVTGIHPAQEEAEQEFEEAKSRFSHILSNTKTLNEKVHDAKRSNTDRALAAGITTELKQSLEQLEVCHRNSLLVENGTIIDDTRKELLEQEQLKFNKLIAIANFKNLHMAHAILAGADAKIIEEPLSNLAKNYQDFILEKNPVVALDLKQDLETQQDECYKYIADIQAKNYLENVTHKMVRQRNFIHTSDKIEAQKNKIHSLYFNQIKTLICATDIWVKKRAISALEKGKRDLQKLIKEQYTSLYIKKSLVESKSHTSSTRSSPSAIFMPILHDKEKPPYTIHQESSPDSLSDERSVSSLSSLSELGLFTEVTENKENQTPSKTSSTVHILAETKERPPLALSQNTILAITPAPKQPVEIVSASPLKQCSAFKPVAPKPISAGAATILKLQS